MLKWGISRKNMDGETHSFSSDALEGGAAYADKACHVHCPESESLKDGTAAEPTGEPKKTPRRKRKLLVPPHSTPSLLASTIQENSEYDKQVDAYRSKFVKLFSFIDTWQRHSGRFEHPHGLAQQVMLGLSMGVGDASGAAAGWADGPESIMSNASPKSNRVMCIEEELQLRLGRMTSIAKTLRDLCSREREQRAGLCKDIFECKDKCIVLLNDVVNHFNKETADLQKQNNDMRKTIKELDNEKQEREMKYEESLAQLTGRIEDLQRELEDSGKQIRLQADEIRTLRNMNSKMEVEKLEARAEEDKLSKKMKGLEKQVKEADTKALAADMARENFETLLNIALSKLRLYEDGELVTYRKASSAEEVFDSPTEKGVWSQRPASRSHTKRTVSDNYSMTSLDTLSMMSEQSMPLADSARYVSDDRLSTVSSQSRQSYGKIKESPIIPPRRKHTNKKQFFHKPFMKKSLSTESQTSHGSMDRLPTIVDEREKESLHRSRDHLSRSKQNLKKSRESINSLGVPYTNGQRDRSAERHVTVVNVGDVTAVITEDKSKTTAPKPANPVKRKVSKKVMRTSSFGALKKPSGGLVAIAKDIEKRFKQKRRSKTADFSTILREPGETASLGTDSMENYHAETDVKDDIY